MIASLKDSATHGYFDWYLSLFSPGIQVDLHSPDSLNCLLPSKVANQALKRALNPQEPEDSLTEEDFALAASLEYVSPLSILVFSPIDLQSLATSRV